MAEVHVDRPGEVGWFTSYGPLPVTGPCPHVECNHLGQGVIAWGPSDDRYELVECGSVNVPESLDDCGTQCRAWVDGRGRVRTPWLMVERP